MTSVEEKAPKKPSIKAQIEQVKLKHDDLSKGGGYQDGPGPAARRFAISSTNCARWGGMCRLERTAIC